MKTARFLLFPLSLATSCAGPRHVEPAPPAPPTAPAPAGPTVAPAPFQNPGGLWMPEQMTSHAAELKRLGLAIDPKLLADPLSSVLGAVVNLGGCSASFVSSEGLVVTNHHCATGALQYNSTPTDNRLKDGYYAATRSVERWVGPTGRVFVTRSLRDVSANVHEALAAASDDLARQRALEVYEKRAVADCEDRPGTRCELVSFYSGLRFYLIEKLELRDVRLVYAPPAGIGNFGGEVDNWRWPRHTGDFAFFRAYVAPSGAPAEHASDNVPYRPPHWLRPATKPLREGDLAIVAGYPGRTSMLEVAREVERTVTWLYPRRLRLFDEYIARLERVTAADADAAIKGTLWLRRFKNFRTKHQGELYGFEQGKLLEKKRAEERELRAFIQASPERTARFGSALDEIERALAERDRKQEADAELVGEILMPRLLWAAHHIVRMAEERPKPDLERDPSYQERKIPDLVAELAALDKRYHPTIDHAMLELALERTLRVPAAERTPALELIAGRSPNAESIARAVAKLYAGSKLADAKRRLALFERATLRELEKSTDTMIRLALSLRPLTREAEERADRARGALLLHGPKRLQALLERRGGAIAPDANRTLRISYGTVRRPPVGSGRAFTTLSELVGKHTGKEPFDAPPALLEAARSERRGASYDSELGDVPVDLLTDLQITNGNSGSPTLDAEGKLTGLAFDGTFESVASDWVFLPNTRSIHVDFRFVRWVLSEVSKTDRLLAELGLPAGQPHP